MNTSNLVLMTAIFDWMMAAGNPKAVASMIVGTRVS